MIEQIEIIGYGLILIVFTIISAILVIDNIKLRKEFYNRLAQMNELENEMRFKFNLRGNER